LLLYAYNFQVHIIISIFLDFWRLC